MLESKVVEGYSIAALSKTTAEPKLIDVLLTVPTIAVPYLELSKSAYAITTLLALESKVIESALINLLLALSKTASLPKLIDVLDTVPTIAVP